MRGFLISFTAFSLGALASPSHQLVAGDEECGLHGEERPGSHQSPEGSKAFSFLGIPATTAEILVVAPIVYVSLHAVQFD